MSRRRRMKSRGLLLLGLAMMPLTVIRAEAQQAASGEAAVQLDSVVADEPGASVASSSAGQGLPRRAPQPRTLHDFWPAFAALAVLWLAAVAYMLPMGGSLRRITDRMLSAENKAGTE